MHGGLCNLWTAFFSTPPSLDESFQGLGFDLGQLLSPSEPSCPALPSLSPAPTNKHKPTLIRKSRAPLATHRLKLLQARLTRFLTAKALPFGYLQIMSPRSLGGNKLRRLPDMTDIAHQREHPCCPFSESSPREDLQVPTRSSSLESAHKIAAGSSPSDGSLKRLRLDDEVRSWGTRSF